MKTYGIKTKLICGFLATALITLSGGIMGLYGINALDKAVDDFGQARMPALDSLRRVKADLVEITSAMRGLLVPGMTPQTRAVQYEAIEKGRERYKSNMDEYKRLPHSPEEAKAVEAMLAEIDAWRTVNNTALDLSHQWDASGIGFPMELRKNINLFRGDHYKAITQALGYLIFENGIFIFGMLLAEAMPLMVEAGVLLDLLVAVFVMGIVMHQINREFSSMNTGKLSSLRE